MATASKNSPSSEDTRSLLECPVCVSTFRNPKSLRCGHSVCFECCQQLRTALHVVCPVCRTRTAVPAEGLPTNFALQDLIEHHVSHQVEKKHVCSACERRHLIDESWICSQCNSALICANCAIKDHRGHDLQMVSEIISRRREELAEWRQRMEGTIREVDARRRQIDANLVRIEQRSMQLHATLRTKLEPRFADAIQELNLERDQLFKTIHEVDVSDIIGATANEHTPATQAHSQFENQLNEVPMKLETLKTKQEQILADQRLALEVVQNCNEVLRQMLSKGLKPNAENRPASQGQDGVGTSTASITEATDLGTRGILGRWGPPRRVTAGRIFPPLERQNLYSPTVSILSELDQEQAARRTLGQESDRLVFGGRDVLRFGAADTSGDEDGMGEDDRPFGLMPITEREMAALQSPDDEQVYMEFAPAQVPLTNDEPVVSLRAAQGNRPAEVLLGRLSMRGGRRGASAGDISTRAIPASGQDGAYFMDMGSDDEMEFRAVRGRGGGRRRGASSGMVPRGKGRGRIFLEANSPSNPVNHSRGDSSQTSATARDPASSPASFERQQQRERRTSGRQRNSGEDGNGASGAAAAAAASGNTEDGTRIQIVSDSSDDDVSGAITFNTFLSPGGRANDKAKH